MQVSKRLVVRKEIPVDNSKDLISSMDVAMAEYYCKNNNYERGLQILGKQFRKYLMKQKEMALLTNILIKL